MALFQHLQPLADIAGNPFAGLLQSQPCTQRGILLRQLLHGGRTGMKHFNTAALQLAQGARAYTARPVQHQIRLQ